MSLAEDLRLQLIELAKSQGIKLSNKSDLRKILLSYFTLQQKLISPKPRTVLVSRQLEFEMLNHSKKNRN